MVLSTNNYETSDCEDSCSGRLLRDIEEISRALYLDKGPAKLLRPSSQLQAWSSGDNVVQDALEKDKKTSVWHWKPLKVLNHFRNRRLKCCFFLRVHAIDGLPSNFNDIALCVNWKRKGEVLKTRPVGVFHGLAEFEETLMYWCTVYGSRNGPQHSAKYEPKFSLLFVSIIGAPAIDIGKHRVDLTRLLPLTIEELEEGKRTSGKWTTSFKLKGKAKGAFLSVSFGFSILGDNPFYISRLEEGPNITEGSVLTNLDDFTDCGQASTNSHLRSLGSVAVELSNRFHQLPSQSIDLNLMDKVLCNQKSELPMPVTLLREKVDKRKPSNSEEFELSFGHKELLKSNSAASSDLVSGETENRVDDADFVVVDKGIEICVKDELGLQHSCESFSSSVIEATETTGNLPVELMNCDEDKVSTAEQKLFSDDSCEGAHNTYNKNYNFQNEESNFRDPRVVSPEIWTSEAGLDTDNKTDDFQVVSPEILTLKSALDSDNKKDFQDKEADVKDPQAILPDILQSESAELSFVLNTSSLIEQEDRMNPKHNDTAGRLVRSLSMDDVMESVANEFLGIFTEQVPGETSSESDPESPRERLLKQFEEECPEFGDAILFLSAGAEEIDFSIGDSTNKGLVPCSDDFDLSFVVQEAEKEHNRVMQTLISRRNAKMLENLETETLMQRWGLNEKAFQNSPRIASGGFGSPVYIPPEEPSELPPLGEGLGPIIRTKGGGIMRSMNSLLFKNAKNGAKLVLQVSIPTVLPAVLGSSVLEILQSWASVGPERLLDEANELMPLEDITGKTMQQVMLEATSCSEDRWAVLHEPLGGDFPFMDNSGEETLDLQNSQSISLDSTVDETSLDFVSLEDLVPLVVANIEALSIEGLKIQSGLSNDEAPSHIRANFTGKWSSTGWNIEHGEATGTSGFTTGQLFDAKSDGFVDVDDLIKLSVPLDQWLKLDAGDISYEHDGRTLKILAAHNANFHVLHNLRIMPSSSNSGLFANSFTLSLRLQLRDPFRDFEMVGGSMLALAQVERVYVPLGKEVCNTESEPHLFLHAMNGNAKRVPKFKISEVHVAGLKVDIDDKQILTTRRQIQMGSRWLISNGMIGKGKQRFSNSTAVVKSSSQLLRKLPGDILWSVTSPVQCPTPKRKEFRALSIHFRNPDVVFPNESQRFL